MLVTLSFLILFLNCIVLALPNPPVARVVEISPTRQARNFYHLAYLQYDLTGAKSRWQLPLSLAGNPDILHSYLAVAQPASRLPLQWSGIYGREMEFDPWGAGLNGENGVGRLRKNIQIPDTPFTHLSWERFALSGNAFQLDFERLVTDSLVFSLGISTSSTDSGGVFRYQDVTHQPFLSTIKRDSSRVPFSGRNLAMDNAHFIPRLRMYKPWGYAELHTSFLTQAGTDATLHRFTRDSLRNYALVFDHSAFAVRTKSSDYGLQLHFNNLAGGFLHFNFVRGELAQDFSQTPPVLDRVRPRDLLLINVDSTRIPFDTTFRDTVVLDTLLRPSSWRNHLHTQRGGLQWNAQALSGNPLFELQWEHQYADQLQDISDTVLAQSRQLAFAEISDTIFGIYGRMRQGVQLQQGNTNGGYIRPAWMAALSTPLPANLLASSHWQYDHRFPDLQELYFPSSARLYYPNGELVPEKRHRSVTELSWHHRFIQLGFAYRFEWLYHAMVPSWVQFPGADTLSSHLAFSLINARRAEHHGYVLQGQISLGNWKFWLERHASLERNLWLKNGQILQQVPHVASRFWKGGWLWHNRVVDGRLGVTTRWDFQWMGGRRDFGLFSNPLQPHNMMAGPLELPPYLVLDFEARMNILRFDLYMRMENLNHSIYHPAVGYAPPGVNFRYGITWYLGG